MAKEAASTLGRSEAERVVYAVDAREPRSCRPCRLIGPHTESEATRFRLQASTQLPSGGSTERMSAYHSAFGLPTGDTVNSSHRRRPSGNRHPCENALTVVAIGYATGRHPRRLLKFNANTYAVPIGQ